MQPNNYLYSRDIDVLQQSPCPSHSDAVVLEELIQQLSFVQHFDPFDSLPLGRWQTVVHLYHVPGLCAPPALQEPIDLRVQGLTGLHAGQSAAACPQIRQHDIAKAVVQIHLLVVDESCVREAFGEGAQEVEAVGRLHVDQDALG